MSNMEIEKKLYYQMLRIRRIEEAIADRYHQQKMRTPVHLSIGQEVVAAVLGMHLKTSDYAISTHRSHAHYLSKGGSLNAMIAEMHGKVTGCCRGRGGSMHLIDEKQGFMGSTAIVGNTIPIGVGLGLSIQLNQEDKISCIYIGDGAAEEGVFYESLNFAILKKLPVLFICENNLYSVYSHLNKRQPPSRRIYEIAKTMGAEIRYGNGYNPLQCYEIVENVIAVMRENPQTYFLEFDTYRWREHCGPNYDNDIGYRSEEEFKSWQEQDPLLKLRMEICQEDKTFENEIVDFESRIFEEIEFAFQFAEQSSFPPASEAITGQYKEGEALFNCVELTEI